jgi:hypothetical protein
MAAVQPDPRLRALITTTTTTNTNTNNNNNNHIMFSVTYKRSLYTPTTQISFSLQSEMRSTVVHLSSRVHYVIEVVIVLHRNRAGMYHVHVFYDECLAP